jgi:ABC-2 type transport system ATP-binding protein
VAVIRKGRLVTVGSPDELRLRQGGPHLEVVGRGFTESVILALRQRPEVMGVSQNDRHLDIHLKDESDTSGLVQLLVVNGVQIDEVRKGKASLEEVFLTLMEEEEHA